MREINLETLEAVIHYTFGKINSNALLKIGEFIYTKRKRRGKQWRKIMQRNRKV